MLCERSSFVHPFEVQRLGLIHTICITTVDVNKIPLVTQKSESFLCAISTYSEYISRKGQARLCLLTLSQTFVNSASFEQYLHTEAEFRGAEA